MGITMGIIGIHSELALLVIPSYSNRAGYGLPTDVRARLTDINCVHGHRDLWGLLLLLGGPI